VTCVHVGVFPPTHNWAKNLENCQAKKRPRLIQIFADFPFYHNYALAKKNIVGVSVPGKTLLYGSSKGNVSRVESWTNY
jgi:hypothetical protein